MNFASTTQLPDDESSTPVPDLARLFRPLGIQFIRVSVVDAPTLATEISWSISDAGEVNENASDRPLDSIFPGAAAGMAELVAATDSDRTLTQRLSPGRWVFAWPLDARRAVVAEAQYRERHDEATDADIAVVRLICSAGLRRDVSAPETGAPPATTLVWPQVDRRARARLSRVSQAAAVLALLAAVSAGWLALYAAPQTASRLAGASKQVAELRGRSDATLTNWLSAAMATGDYGEAQSELTQFRSMGYFESAVVVNPKGRVVALEGSIERMRIGAEPTAEYLAAARPLELAFGSVGQGQLLMMAPGTAPPVGTAGLHVFAWLACAASLATFALIALRLRHR